MHRRDILKGAVALAVAPAATLAAPSPIKMSIDWTQWKEEVIYAGGSLDRLKHDEDPFAYSRELPRRRQGTPINTSMFQQTYSVPLRSPLVVK